MLTLIFDQKKGAVCPPLPRISSRAIPPRGYFWDKNRGMFGAIAALVLAMPCLAQACSPPPEGMQVEYEFYLDADPLTDSTIIVGRLSQIERVKLEVFDDLLEYDRLTLSDTEVLRGDSEIDKDQDGNLDAAGYDLDWLGPDFWIEGSEYLVFISHESMEGYPTPEDFGITAESASEEELKILQEVAELFQNTLVEDSCNGPYVFPSDSLEAVIFRQALDSGDRARETVHILAEFVRRGRAAGLTFRASDERIRHLEAYITGLEAELNERQAD